MNRVFLTSITNEMFVPFFFFLFIWNANQSIRQFFLNQAQWKTLWNVLSLGFHFEFTVSINIVFHIFFLCTLKSNSEWNSQLSYYLSYVIPILIFLFLIPLSASKFDWSFDWQFPWKIHTESIFNWKYIKSDNFGKLKNSFYLNFTRFRFDSIYIKR